MGIKTVVNLRSFHSDQSQCAKEKLDYVEIREKAWHAEDEDAVAFLRVITDPDRQPVFVHCHHGSDRTGTMCAAYRIVVQGWSKDAAIREMTDGGYGFHPEWQNLIDYIRKMDVASLRRRAGLESQPATTQPATK
jgi:protein tyrosine/serine phosphatase